MLHSLAQFHGAWIYLPAIMMLSISIAVAAALGASAVVLAMHWLGVRPGWASTVKMVLVSCLVYEVIQLVIFITGTSQWRDVLTQTLLTYIQILCFGLPFTLVWLWATKGATPLDRKRRKA